MPYDFTSHGIINSQQSVNTDSALRDQSIDSMQLNFKDFLKENFILTSEQINLISSIPDNVTQNIGRNLANGLQNNYTILIDIGNFSVKDPPNPTVTNIRCSLNAGATHDDQCHWTESIGISCSFS